MIHRVYSTLKSFKEIVFRPDFNVLLADKTAESTAQQTRNRAGKSSLIEIIHFLTAAECPDDSIFLIEELVHHRFGMEFDLGGRRIAVERTGSRPKEMIVRSGDTSGWPVQPEVSVDGERVLKLKDWERVLGTLVFGIEGLQTRNKSAWAPTFRSIFPYFVRRSPGGFTEPHLHFVQSKPASWQVAVTYLLGLDWTIPQEWQAVRDEEDEIKKLKAAVGEGDLVEIVGKKAQLRADIASQERSVAKFLERINEFRVLPDFQQYEERANTLTKEIADLSGANTLDRELLTSLEEAITDEKPPEFSQLERLYDEAGIALPGVVLRRFDEVRQFHESVISNRKTYLSAEIANARDRITRRERDKDRLESERAQVMGILRSHGALEQFSKLQADYGKRVAEVELLRKRFSAAEKIEEGLAKLKIRRQQLLLRLKQDYSEQSTTLNKAILAFEEISSRLYEKPAKFTPVETQNGPQFKIEVQGERSPGISHMQIYCFDMMFMQLMAERGTGPRFLVHDSHLFDPVDARQVGIAFALGKQLAVQHQFQYIVTMNSDKAIEAPPDFRWQDYVLSTKLTDATDTGGLFGIRFG